MSYHVQGTLPDGSSVYADYRQPIVTVMRRQIAASVAGRPADAADAELVAEWAAANPQDVCEIPFMNCAHGPASPEPFTPPPYRPGEQTLF
jgi:hypothetical protein